MTDETILALYEARSEEAIRLTEERYGKLAYSLAFRLLSSREEAEECVNDAYIQLWHAIPPEKPRKFSAYLCKVTRNLALNRLKAESRQKREANRFAEELNESIPDGRSFTDRLILKEALESFLKSLPVITRKIFLGRYFYCLSIDELSKCYGESVSNVKVILHRTRQNLKHYLEKENLF